MNINADGDGADCKIEDIKDLPFMNKMMEEKLIHESQTIKMLDSEIKNSKTYLDMKLRP